jgi:hypothetical protein
VSASIPPCLDPVVAAAQRDLDTLMQRAELHQRARRIIAVGNYGVPETTLGTPEVPSIIEPECFSCEETATCEVEEDGGAMPVCHECGEAYRAMGRVRR